MMPMMCAWQELLQILPPRLRANVDAHGKKVLQELRLRIGQAPELICGSGSVVIGDPICTDDVNYVINTASRYSPWAAATASRGYITAPGGHRIGICGDAVMMDGKMNGIRRVRSVCIRVARDYTGIAAGIPHEGSVLIIGPPGAGKTTLLRDLIRQRSDGGLHSICVVDERGELFPSGFQTGMRTDILTGCTKEAGIPSALRSMGPGAIAVDEITEESDVRALCQAAGCGISLLATAHGSSYEEMKKRTAYQKLFAQGIFHILVILREDKSWRTERITI